MKTGLRMPVSVMCTMVLVASVGCERQDTSPAPAQPAAAKAPPAEPSHAPPADSKLTLEGLTMTVPDGWLVALPARPGSMAPKAIYSLAKAEDDDADATVRVTYFPNMKGMNDANIARWVGQVRRADGSPSTRDDAKIANIENGSVHLTIVDVSGAISARMGHAGGGDPGQRMIVAIVDHPKGPHFVKALGRTATIEKWHDAIHAFLKSATAN